MKNRTTNSNLRSLLTDITGESILLSHEELERLRQYLFCKSNAPYNTTDKKVEEAADYLKSICESQHLKDLEGLCQYFDERRGSLLDFMDDFLALEHKYEKATTTLGIEKNVDKRLDGCDNIFDLEQTLDEDRPQPRRSISLRINAALHKNTVPSVHLKAGTLMINKITEVKDNDLQGSATESQTPGVKVEESGAFAVKTIFGKIRELTGRFRKRVHFQHRSRNGNGQAGAEGGANAGARAYKGRRTAERARRPMRYK